MSGEEPPTPTLREPGSNPSSVTYESRGPLTSHLESLRPRFPTYETNKKYVPPMVAARLTHTWRSSEIQAHVVHARAEAGSLKKHNPAAKVIASRPPHQMGHYENREGDPNT